MGVALPLRFVLLVFLRILTGKGWMPLQGRAGSGRFGYTDLQGRQLWAEKNAAKIRGICSLSPRFRHAIFLGFFLGSKNAQLFGSHRIEHLGKIVLTHNRGRCGREICRQAHRKGELVGA